MTLSVDIADPVPAHQRTSRLALPALASAGLHLALGAAFALNLLTSDPGGGGVQLEAISVEMVDGRALDARAITSPASRELGSTASVADTEGVASPVETASADAAQPVTKIEERKDKPSEKAAVLETGSLPAPPAPLAEQQNEAKEEPKEEKPLPPPASVTMPSGGVASRVAEPSASAMPAQAGASPGEVNRYNGSVSRSLSTLMRRLASSGHRGQVRILFIVGEKGDVTDVQVRESSGDSSLDALAAKLLRDASFPEPPPRMTEAQRTFLVPVRVR